METSFDNQCDTNYLKFVGWKYSSDNPAIQRLFSEENIKTISNKITELLEGVDKDGKSIIVTDRVICNLLSHFVESHPYVKIGGIHSRYIIADKEETYYITSIIDRTIETIVSYIKNSIGMEETNQSLSIWNSILGGQNELGLLPHPKIKLLEKHPQYMAFNMNY